jgi:hypothetical protein
MTAGSALDGMAARAILAWQRPSWWNLLVVLPWAVALIFLIQESKTDRQIAGRQQMTSGIVTAHEPSNHDRYGYRFEVHGKPYGGWQIPGNSELALGQQVTIFYDPHNPNRNSLTDFHDLSTSSLGPVPMLLFGISAVAAFVIYRRRSNPAATRPGP